MGHPELMSTKSTSAFWLMSSAHLVMVSGKQPSTCRQDDGSDRTAPGRRATRTGIPGRTHLDSEQVLTLVPLQERPLRLLTLQQVGAHRHLAAGDVGAEALTDAAERQVPALRSGAITPQTQTPHFKPRHLLW